MSNQYGVNAQTKPYSKMALAKRSLPASPLEPSKAQGLPVPEVPMVPIASSPITTADLLCMRAGAVGRGHKTDPSLVPLPDNILLSNFSYFFFATDVYHVIHASGF